MIRSIGDRIPRCGDVVRHAPSGEYVVVAFADPVSDELSLEGQIVRVARLSECILMLAGPYGLHMEDVDYWRSQLSGDFRRSHVLRLYGTREEIAS